MRVCNQNPVDGLTPQRLKDRLDMAGKRRPGIDYRDMAMTNDERRSPWSGERARVPGDDPPNQRRYGFQNAVFELKVVVKTNIGHLCMVSGITGMRGWSPPGGPQLNSNPDETCLVPTLIF